MDAALLSLCLPQDRDFQEDNRFRYILPLYSLSDFGLDKPHPTV